MSNGLGRLETGISADVWNILPTYGRCLIIGTVRNGSVQPDHVSAAPPQPPSLKTAIGELERAIEGESGEVQAEYRWWLRTWARLIMASHRFKARFYPRLQRGDIVTVDFGWNVGRELAGRHWAVVLNVKDDKKSAILVVLPLSSEKSADGRPRETRKYEENLGYVIPQSPEELRKAGRQGPVRSIARLDQMRAISKQRVDYTRTHRLLPGELSQLDQRLFSMFFGATALGAMAEVAAGCEDRHGHRPESPDPVDRDHTDC